MCPLTIFSPLLVDVGRDTRRCGLHGHLENSSCATEGYTESLSIGLAAPVSMSFRYILNRQTKLERDARAPSKPTNHTRLLLYELRDIQCGPRRQARTDTSLYARFTHCTLISGRKSVRSSLESAQLQTFGNGQSYPRLPKICHIPGQSLPHRGQECSSCKVYE